MRMFKGLRAFIRMSLALCFVLTLVVLVHAGNVPATAPDSITSKDIIMILFGLLNTILVGIGVWLIGNDREIFTRLRDVESKQSTRDALCEERNDQGEHYHKRASDGNAGIALKETVDTLRRLLHEMETNKGV